MRTVLALLGCVSLLGGLAGLLVAWPVGLGLLLSALVLLALSAIIERLDLILDRLGDPDDPAP